MKTKKSVDHPVAIPTTYRGIQLKSRLEAQAAFLFDTFRIPWQYEPTSLMLPNGICYTPDFWLPRQRAVLECRGYNTENGDKQIECFGEVVLQQKKTFRIPAGGAGVASFIVLTGDEGTRFYQRYVEGGEDGVLVAQCCLCGNWSLVGFNDRSCLPCSTTPNALEIAMALIVKKGKLFINGRPSEGWGNGSV